MIACFVLVYYPWVTFHFLYIFMSIFMLWGRGLEYIPSAHCFLNMASNLRVYRGSQKTNAQYHRVKKWFAAKYMLRFFL